MRVNIRTDHERSGGGVKNLVICVNEINTVFIIVLQGPNQPCFRRDFSMALQMVHDKVLAVPLVLHWVLGVLVQSVIDIAIHL